MYLLDDMQAYQEAYVKGRFSLPSFVSRNGSHVSKFGGKHLDLLSHFASLKYTLLTSTLDNDEGNIRGFMCKAAILGPSHKLTSEVIRYRLRVFMFMM